MIIRVDDFPSGSDRGEILPTYRQDFAVFHAAMDRIPYLLGVVPSFVTPDDMDWLRTLGQDGVEIACHGINHRRREFELSTVAAIANHLRTASPLVHSAAFIPPFNWISPQLMTALQLVGYKLVTTGPETLHCAGSLAYAGSLRVVESPWYGYARDLLTRWRQGERPGPADCLTLHWTWERKDQFGSLRELVPLIRPEVVSWARTFPEVFHDRHR